MKILWTVFMAFISFVSVTGAATQGDVQKATAVNVRASGFFNPRIVTLRSMPPQFRLTLTHEMPSAGWTFNVDDVEVNPTDKQITVRVTRHAPEGVAAQVITPVEVHIALGDLEIGQYFLELWGRDVGAASYWPEGAFVLEAKTDGPGVH